MTAKIFDDLSSTDVWRRYGAVKKLRHADPLIAETLVVIAQDSSALPLARIAAIEAIAGARSDTVTEALRRLLHDDDPAVSCATIRALVRIGMMALVPDIESCLTDLRRDWTASAWVDDDSVAAAARWALHQLKPGKIA